MKGAVYKLIRRITGKIMGIVKGINWQIMIALLTLIVLIVQAGIYLRQASIMNFQGKLFERQTAVLEDQRNMATRPDIQVEVIAEPSSPDRTGPWVIRNRGKYQVQNLRMTYLHFTKFNKGWRVITGSSLKLRSELASQDSVTINLKWLRSAVTNTTPKGLAIQDGLEFVVLMLHFERGVDLKQYIYLEPFYVLKGVPVAMAEAPMSGSLARICAPEVELVFEYFKRLPLEMPEEIYNKNYVFGYYPTGCLGPIQWLDVP